MISENSKLAEKEYKVRHSWVGKEIHWELYKKLKFDHTNKWYIHNPEYVLENDTQKLLWDFEIRTRPYNNHQKREILQNCGPQIESEKRDKYLNLARGLKKLWNLKMTIIPIAIGALGTVTKGLVQGLEDLEIRGRGETVQTSVLLRSARILRRFLET